MAEALSKAEASPENDASQKELAESVHEAVRQQLHGRVFKVVTVGPPGVGKSMLVNTLLVKKICKVGWGAKAVTRSVLPHRCTVDLKGDEKDSASIDMYDSPGFSGNEEEDETAMAALRKVKDPDLILICFDMGSNSGRYMPMVQGFILNQVRSVWSDLKMDERAVIVLTKANLVWDSYENATGPENVSKVATGSSGTGTTVQLTFQKEVENWRREYARDQKQHGHTTLPVCYAGRIEFGETTETPTGVTKIEETTDWLQELWNTVAKHTTTDLVPLLYICVEQAHQDPSISQDILDNLPRPDDSVVAGIVGYATAAGTLALTAGSAVISAAGAAMTGLYTGAAYALKSLTYFWSRT